MAEGGGYFQSGGFHLPHHQQHHQGHVESPAYPPASTECKGELVKIFCQARPDYNLAVRDYEVVLVPGDDNDPYQQWIKDDSWASKDFSRLTFISTWIKDESWSTKVKDSAGFPAFALINKATGKALRHAEGMEAPVVLEEYEPNVLNEVILWTTSDDVSDGYKAIRPVNNIHLNLDADHGLEKYGGVKDGNKVIFFKWKHEPNQLWMFGHLEPREYESQAYIPPQHEQRYDHHSLPQGRFDHHQDPRLPPQVQYDHHQDPRLPPQERYDHHQDPRLPPQERYDHHQDPRLHPQGRYDHHQDPRLPPQGRYDHHQDPRLPPQERYDQLQDPHFRRQERYDHHHD